MIDQEPGMIGAGASNKGQFRLELSLRILAILAAAALLLILAVQYQNFLEDDALISATYAQRLLEGKGLTWTDGTHVEGYSNLLWVLATALVGLVEPDLVMAIRVLAVACFLSTAVLLGLWGMGRRPFLGAASVAALAFVTSGPVSVWTFGGLEQPLLAILLVSASGLFLTVLDEPSSKPSAFIAPGVVFGLMFLVRPDAPLWWIPPGLAVLLSAGTKEGRVQRLAALSLGPVVALVGVQTFRLMYYNAWVPNTALVKLSPSGKHFADGLRYVLGGWAGVAPIAIIAGAAVLSFIGRERSLPIVIYLGLGPCLWSAYLIFIGGGIFSGYRHFVPIVAVLAVGIAYAGDRALRSISRRRIRLMVGVGIAMLIGLNIWVQSVNAEFLRAGETSWVWAGRDIARLLVDAYGSQEPTLAVTAAGSIPFWTGFSCIDMLGLNDRFIAHHRPQDLGKGMIGHEYGDGAYVLSRKPDIIQPCGPWGGIEPCYRAVKDLYREGLLQRFYAPVTLRRPPGRGGAYIHSTIWLRRDSPRVGVRKVGNTQVVPATLIRPEVEASGSAWVSGPEQIAVALRPGQAYVARLPLKLEGEWSAHLDPPVSARIEIEKNVDRDGAFYPVLRILPLASGSIQSIILTPMSNAPLETEPGEGAENLSGDTK